MKASDETYIMISCGGKTILDATQTHIKESISYIIERLQSSWHRGDGELIIKYSHKPFDDSLTPEGYNKRDFEAALERGKDLAPQPNESREDYIERMISIGYDRIWAENSADVMGMPKSEDAIRFESDMQAQRYRKHATQRAWDSLTPGEQSELKRHMETHWAGTRFWNGIHRFD